MGKRRYFCRGQGEAKSLLLWFEIIIALAALFMLYFTIMDKEALVGHADLDQELTHNAEASLPLHVEVARNTEPLFSENAGGEENG